MNFYFFIIQISFWIQFLHENKRIQIEVENHNEIENERT